MEFVTELKCSLPSECTSLSPTAMIWQDILVQAMTGELVAAMNYTALSETIQPAAGLYRTKPLSRSRAGCGFAKRNPLQTEPY